MSTTKQNNQPKQNQRLPIRASINWLNPNEDESLRARVSLSIGGAFAVHGIKVLSGSKGDFVSMPSYKSGDNYKDIFHATSAEAREQMNEAVMKAYEQKLEEQNQNNAPAQEDSPGEDPDEDITEDDGPQMTM